MDVPEQAQPPNYDNTVADYPGGAYNVEGSIANIVDQIDPQMIIDNFNHALKGEYYNKEKGIWESAGDGSPLVNDSCRSWIISYLTALMNKASTLATINEKQFSGLMEGIIRNVGREFVCNLEKFGFVPEGKDFAKKDYHNIGIPDSARMDSIAEAMYQRAFVIYSRSINGMESKKIFSSLSMSDPMSFNPQQQKAGFGGLFR